jgi:uncharacterized membrane protein
MKKKIIYLVITSVICGLVILLSLIPNLGYITIPGWPSIAIVLIPVMIGISILPFWYSLVIGIFFGGFSLITSLMYAANVADQAFQNPLVSVLPRIIFVVLAFLLIRLFQKLFLLSTKVKRLVGYLFLCVIIAISLFLISQFIYKTWFIDNETANGLILSIFSGLFVLCAFLMYFRVMRYPEKNQLYLAFCYFFSSFIHTFLVILALYLFADKTIFGGTNFMDFLSIILISNGIVEALLSSVVCSVVYFALKKVGKFHDIIN